MEILVIVTAIALLQAAFFSYQVGVARLKYGVKAPSITGDVQFERVNRVHQNTLEQLVLVVPGMWMFGYFVNPTWAAGVGLVFVVTRFIYSNAYTGDPSKRTIGFTLGFLATMVLVVGSLVGAVMTLLAK